jgi:hypothetical protein
MVELKPRKIIQIATDGGEYGTTVVALCDDGTLWESFPIRTEKGWDRQWRQLKLPPGSESGR